MEVLASNTHVFNTGAAICCHFLNFPNRANEQRGLHFSETLVVLGIDMGQKFLKTTLQVINLKEEEGSRKSQEKFKSTGVRKLHFAAICDYQVPETHYISALG